MVKRYLCKNCGFKYSLEVLKEVYDGKCGRCGNRVLTKGEADEEN